MPQQTTRSPAHLRPQARALALEPRILFDGAVAASVEHHQHHTDVHAQAADKATTPQARNGATAAHAASADTPQARDGTTATKAASAENPMPQARDGATAAAATPAQNLVVIDSRVDNYQSLLTDLPQNTQVLIINAGDDALTAISSALASMGKADSIQIFSHGAAGQFTLGNRTYDAQTLQSLASSMSSWRSELTAGADIFLYGCDVGAGAEGQTLVNTLANITGAGVAASSNDTGAASAGGDWVLEVSSGVIDRHIALSDNAVSHYGELLANASPTVTISTPTTSVLLGDQVTFNVTLTNASSQVGYAPFIDLFLPKTGKDGDDGLSFVSASYLGQAVTAYVVTFDSNGNAVHPLAKDSSGNSLIINAASYGLRAGDSMVVLQLPYGSVSQSQPAITVQVTASLSDLADTSLSNASPDLVVKARGGFQFGNDSLDNPTTDPSIVGAATASFTVHPTVVTLTQSVQMPEGETVTGPNYVHTETVTITPAPGQTIDNVVVTQPMPDNVQVTAITPSNGGTVTSLTLHDGTILTNPTAIAAAIASQPLFISSYTVTYSSISAPVDVVVSFYVPESDANGQPVLNPQTGANVSITFGTPTASGEWVPLDPRDVTPPATTIDFSGSGDGTGGTFVAKALTVQKTVTDTNDVGTPGITPGDTLDYQLDLAISDFFAVGETLTRNGSFVLTDTASDGQTVTGTPTFTFSINGVSHTVALNYTSTVNADGTTTLRFDIAGSILNAGILGALVGDLAFDNNQQGATTGTIHYTTLVNQAYTSSHPQSEINEGDTLGNSATVSGTLMVDRVNLTGSTVSDTSSTSSTIATSAVDIEITGVNGGTPPSSGELNPGDVVTFEMSYDLITGDYENFSLTAYLPLPLFNLSSINWSQGTGVGTWAIGSGNTNGGAVDSVTTGAGNAVIFNFGDYATASTSGSKIVVTFTLKVGDTPYADQRSLNVLAQSDQTTTLTGQHLVSSDVATIVSVAEPVLTITQGVVSNTGNGVITGTTGTWSAPGSTGVPFTGSVTDLTTVAGSITGIDGGDTLRLATAIENSGGGGAYDVVTSVTIPAGLQFSGGSLAAADLQIYRGDGTLLVAGTDYQVSGNVITFLDHNSTATLLPGRSGTAADTSGQNVVVITYDVKVVDAIAASATLQTSAILSNYASVEGGTDFTPVDLVAQTGEQVAAPTVNAVFAGGSNTTAPDSDSSASHTTGNNLVIGEGMLYDLVVTLPEGTSQTLSLDGLIPAGMRLDTSFNNGLGYQVITTSAASTALTGNFAGTVTVSGISGLSGGTLGNDGVGAHWTFSGSSASADNVTTNNSFVIRVQLIADNVSSNQAGTQLPVSARISYSDPDGDTPNGATPATRTVNQSISAPTAVVVEPTLQVTQSYTGGSTLGVDEGDTVDYTITITNGSASSDYNAFDINFQDVLPSELTGLSLVSVSLNGGATNNGGSDFQLVGHTLSSVSGANIDIPKGGSIVLHVTGTVVAAAASEQNFSNTATVQWTSLDGTQANSGQATGERTGTDGVLNSGVLNDYRVANTLVVPVEQGLIISRVGGLPATPAPNPTDTASEQVTIGELIRYRVTAVVAEGTTNDYVLQVTLQNGLQFINDGTAKLALVSDQGNITSSFSDLVTGGSLDVVGSRDTAIGQNITADLSGAAPSAIFNTASHLTVTTDSNGNQVLQFHLGTLNNPDNDPNLEGISLEFSVRVMNQASNVAGAALAVSAQTQSGSTVLAHSDTISENIVEPVLSGLNKQIIQFDPNANGSSGTAQVGISFTAGGTIPAYNVELTDGYPSGSNLTGLTLVINGTSYDINSSSIPSSLGFSYSFTGNTITADFAELDPGTTVKLTYQITLPNSATIASTNARLTWTSLPDSFTTWGGSTVGTSASTTGERTGSGTGANQYVLTEGAGLGLISGTLWDDTASATASTTPDGPALAGQTVTLTWAGADGNLATTADNLTYTATTDVNGQYHFGDLAAGVYQITTNAGIFNYGTIGNVAVRIDSDSSTPLGQVNLTVGESGTGTANFGYVQQNDPPVNHLPSPPTGLEDTSLHITGVSISDVDAGNGTMTVALGVLHGKLNLTPTTGVTITGQGTANVVLSGNIVNINTALATLTYLGNQDYNGTDTLTMTTNDNGNFGDHNGDGIPGQAADALSVTNSLQINITPVNDAPIGVNDTAAATEAGGTNNNTVGVDPRGNVLTNDIDVDIATNGDVLHVVAVQPLNGTLGAVAATGNVLFVGQYGTLSMGADGGYQYTVDNSNPAVQALRTAGQRLIDSFTYTLADTAGAQSTALLVVTIHGANDTPTATLDTGTATEAGGVNNGTVGSNATGNVLTNDSDVDSAANGEVLHVSGVRNQPASSSSPLTPVNTGTTSANGTQIVGTYGTLTIGADGTYRYVVDNNNAAVQALVPGTSLLDTFSYQVTDAGGLSDLANIVITVQGAYDNPVATDNTTHATAGSPGLGTAAIAGTGNVITDDNGQGVDHDVDAPDQVAGALTVTGARTGTEAAGGTISSVTAGSTSTSSALALTGLYGTLHIGADGSYEYDVDSNNAAVQALPAGATLTETFTYRLSDSEGLTDTAQLVVTVTGVNDPPVPTADTAHAIEAGGVNNQTAGLDPTGNVLSNDRDPDGDAMSVTGIQTSGGTTGTVGTALVGAHGTLTLGANGQYTYVVNNNDTAVQALRTASDQITDQFTYTVSDSHGASATTTLTVTITGQNDAPVGVNDTGDATEAGGVGNATPGSNATGNVLTNDQDVDSGDTRTVNGGHAGALGTGSFTAVTAPTAFTGQYGTLTLQPDGSYTYVVDNSNATVNALAPGQTLVDNFSYQLRDTAGLTGTAQLAITVHGANDAPTAQLDLNYALSDNGQGQQVNANGNVMTNDHDPDNGDTITVTAGGTGSASSNPSLNPVTAGSSVSTGTPLTLTGTYGTLTLGADGTYQYVIDVNNPVVQTLTGSSFRLEQFAYQITDSGGLTSTATLDIIVRGRNDPPEPQPDTALAVEASGLHNSTPGLNPSGNVLDNDTDPDNGDVLSVTTVHTGAPGSGGTPVNAGTTLQGQYGQLDMNADGSWTYTVDNSLPAVEALRTAGQTLTEQFTYTASDQWGLTTDATLTVVISGRNDTPIAVDDTNTAVEAGGVHNGTPGINPTGNVLSNDTDVDSTVNGETKAVGNFANSSGRSVAAGSALAGQFGTLTINADGSYQYTVDNSNSQVDALQQGQTLTEVYTYQMHDADGATSTARLSITIQGRNDAPVANPDTNVASDQFPSPQATGNVLTNDTDVDNGDHLAVAGVHTGQPSETGTQGQLGQPLAGQYGTLVLNANGSYSYQIDLTNPDVLKAAGMGQVLHDTFTYTVTDLAGATSQATLTLNLDISQPYVPPPSPSPPHDGGDAGPHYGYGYDTPYTAGLNRSVDPVVFVTPEVQVVDAQLEVSAWQADGSDLRLGGLQGPLSPSIGAGLGLIPDVHVANSVHQSQQESALDQAWLMGRQSRTDLTADGLLDNPSVFALTPRSLTEHPVTQPHSAPHHGHRPAPHHHAAPRTAAGFKAQLEAASTSLPASLRQTTPQPHTELAHEA
ncbi:VCBS domain-containing protein [Silvimonas amylolytica]|uniref:DUF4347 domain-containing protein n=1 Tax=Silvimonas amylolytica TaxID=449663 RepID=A0ABQ2PGY9_9NEIS|nr:VCBS domain-containing protein [Silvimonas amylolytica]GGP24882.1 hypothetical protein GCM10010971_07010 [Silvimonas amylolytica]